MIAHFIMQGKRLKVSSFRIKNIKSNNKKNKMLIINKLKFILFSLCPSLFQGVQIPIHPRRNPGSSV